MKIFSVEFDGMWPAGNCCIIAAHSLSDAQRITRNTIIHTDKIVVYEININNPKVIVYLSGDY